MEPGNYNAEDYNHTTMVAECLGIHSLFITLTSIIIYVGYRWNLYVKRKYKRRMEEFNLAKEKETYKLKVNFFVNLVHEIRTPLSLICLPLEKLRENKREDEYVSMIDKNVNYLLNITNQLLDFQKIESNGVLLNPKPCHFESPTCFHL